VESLAEQANATFLAHPLIIINPTRVAGNIKKKIWKIVLRAEFGKHDGC
jgi:hypothetical protein